MKRILSSILILILLFSLVSCGGKDKKADSKNVVSKEVTADTKNDAFPKDTKFEVTELKSGPDFELAKNALKTIAKKQVIYDITATKDGETVQPDGTVKVTFPIPKDSNEKKLALKYITNDGAMEDIPYKTNKKSNTITATLSQLGLYAVIEVQTEGNNGTEEECLHAFIAATCTEAKTCDKCKITEGAPLGHDFAKGVCKRCNYKK